MRSRWLAVALILVAGAGCRTFRHGGKQPDSLTVDEANQAWAEGMRLYSEQPRTVDRVSDAAELMEQAAWTFRTDFKVQWQAAQVWAWLAENDTTSKARKTAAEHGTTAAKRAKELNPERVEGFYWYAINVGLRANADRIYGLKAVGEMEPALKKAVDLDSRYDMGGPLRVLGILYLRTPGPPVSIGSVRKSLRLLQRAAENFPEYPENYLYLAEALRENKRIGEAKEALAKVVDAKPWSDREYESKQWQTEATKLLATLSSPKSSQ
jgi:hypothetical protein